MSGTQGGIPAGRDAKPTALGSHGWWQPCSHDSFRKARGDASDAGSVPNAIGDFCFLHSNYMHVLVA